MIEPVEHFRNIASIKGNQKWDDKCEAIINDFLGYFEYMREQRVRGLGLSQDRNFDAGAIDFCTQSIEKARTFKEE